MGRKILAILAAGATLIAGTVWVTYPSSKPKSIGDPAKYRFMHCPECNRESMYTPAAYEKPCPYCDKSLIATEVSIKESGGAGNPFNQMFLCVLTELIAIMGGIWFVTRPRPKNLDEDYLYINCEKCRQKLRYHVAKIGQMAMCSRCRHPFIYPEEE